MYDEYLFFCFFKQKTAYDMRISDWSSDVCSSDLVRHGHHRFQIAQIFVSAPILGEFHRRTHQLPAMTFQLGLQPFEQREGVSCRARQTPDDGAIMQLANLFRIGLHDRLAHGYLAIPGHHSSAALREGEECDSTSKLGGTP